MKMVLELTLSSEEYYKYKAIEEMFRTSDLYNKIFIAAQKNEKAIVVSRNEIEGKGFNFSGYLIGNGFTVVNRPNKKAVILW